MKRLILSMLCCSLLLCSSVFAAGTITEEQAYIDNTNGIHTRIITWTSSSGGVLDDLLLKNIDGYVLRITTLPGVKGIYTLINSLKTKLNAHAADLAEHATAIDDVNFPVSTNNPENIGEVLRLVGELLTAYDVHDDDAELGAAWAYHIAQEAGNATPTSVETPDTIAEAITRLNNLKAVLNTHDADSTAHTTGGTHQEATTDSGGDNPTTLYDITLLDKNGIDALEGQGLNRSATVTEEYTFTSMPRYVYDDAVLDIDNVGNSKTGTIILEIYKGR